MFTARKDCFLGCYDVKFKKVHVRGLYTGASYEEDYSHAEKSYV